MTTRFSISPAFPMFSAGFVITRLFFPSLVSSPTWSIAAFTPPSRDSFGLILRRNSDIAVRTVCGDHHSNKRWTNSLSPSSRSLWSLFSTDSNIESTATGACYDDSVLRLLNESTVQQIDCLVHERSTARWQGNYTIADDLKSQIVYFSGIPAGYEIVLHDVPRALGGKTRWNLLHTNEIYDQELLSGPTILQLAHAAVGLAVENNQQTQTRKRQQYRQKSLESLVENAKSRLGILLEETRMMDEINSVFEVSTKNTMVQSELGGRTAADAALWFAFAGSRDEDLFHGLADIASWELQRFGRRPSFRSKYMLQILERFAAAGLKQHDKLERIARACLMEKEEEPQSENGMPMITIGSDVYQNHQQSYCLNLHSDRSLLLIWKFATKQKKQRAFFRSAKKNWEQYHEEGFDTNISIETARSTDGDGEHRNDPNEEIVTPSYDWDELFEDASRPLVVDVGCGMGVSLLGLASTEINYFPCSKESSRLLLGERTSFQQCNFVGVDLGSLGIEYARGIARRWSLEENLHFAIDTAENFCRHLESYPGEILCCMIQFPTPFRLQNKDTGNSQLPVSQVDGFMVTENLLEIIRSSLHPTKGRLLLQSNCEDVAVWMRHLACRNAGFTAVDDGGNNNIKNDAVPQVPERVPQRTLDWIAMDGDRAEGRGWFQREILHRRGATETEVSCAINGTPVHRCLLRVVADAFEKV